MAEFRFTKNVFNALLFYASRKNELLSTLFVQMDFNTKNTYRRKEEEEVGMKVQLFTEIV